MGRETNHVRLNTHTPIRTCENDTQVAEPESKKARHETDLVETESPQDKDEDVYGLDDPAPHLHVSLPACLTPQEVRDLDVCVYRVFAPQTCLDLSLQ